MNKHIEIVKKWLKDNDSVSLKELQANKQAAGAAYAAAAADTAAAGAAYAAYAASDAATNAAINAAMAAAHAYFCADDAAYWVEHYEELTK